MNEELTELPSSAIIEPRRGLLSILAYAVCAALVLGGMTQYVNRTNSRLHELEVRTSATAKGPDVNVEKEKGTRQYIEGMLSTKDSELQAWEAVVDDARVTRVLLAMHTLARREPCRDCNGVGLVRRWGGKPDLFAEAIVMAADRHGVDPLTLVAISWRETRFDATAKGDSHLGKTVLSCGPTQVRVDFPGRPTCEQLQDVAYAMDWTAKKLDNMRDEYGRIRVTGWNGGSRYEIEVSRDVSWLREHLGN